MAVMVLTTLPVVPQPAAAQANPFFSIDAPTQVEVGQSITFTLSSRGIGNIAGYEAVMLFDTDVAAFQEMQQRNNDLTRLFGRDVEPLAAVEVPYGAAFGIVSCPFRSCVRPAGGRQTEGGRGNVELARITILAYQEGVLEVTFDAMKVVHANGFTLPVNIPSRTFNIQVGPPGSGPHFAAPPSPWTVSRSNAGAQRPVDITESGNVTYNDVVEVAMEWQVLREQSKPCGNLRNPTLDINGDGCIDVSDVQLVASQLASSAGSSLSTESSDLLSSESTHALQQAARVYTVNSTSDTGNATIGNGVCATSTGVCTLRAALQEAVRYSGSTTINFNIPGTGVQTIVLGSSLPTIWNTSGPITIDGYTQPGASPNTHAHVSNAQIRVQIQGAGPEGFEALRISSSNNVIRGLAWYNFSRVFWLYGQNAGNNVFTGNFVGTNAAGTFTINQTAESQAHGFHLEMGAAGNRIGGTSAAERNVISGNARHGVGMWHGGTNANILYNNLVGLSPNGNSCLRNRIEGVDMNYGASNNIIGGTATGQRNVFTGMVLAGVDISHGTNTTGNQVIGNLIGTNAAGTGLVSNCTNNRLGIRIKDGVRNNVVSQNIIGGSRGAGIEFESPPQPLNDNITTNNTITNNWIGVTPEGVAIANPIGILINGQKNRIGPGNVIAHNTGNGVQLVYDVSRFNTITQNSIYNNGSLGIDLWPSGVTPNDAGDADNGPNQNLNFPVITSASTTTVSGTACAGCTVEIFVADRNTTAHGQGRTFVGSGAANSSGNFSIAVSGFAAGAYVTSTATDQTGNTSEFSRNVITTSGSSVTPPAAPSNLQATAVSATRIDLTWTDNANNEANMVVERSLDGSTWSVLATLPANTTSHSDTNVSGSTTYHYRVSATNAAGSSAPSNTASATTHAAPSAPAAPSNLQATAVSATRVDLTWTDNANNEDNMVVERSFNGATWSVLATLPANTTSYSHTSARVNSTYHYRVSATNGAGSSAASNSATATTATSLPGRVQAEDYREGGTGFGYHDTTAGNSGGAYRNDNVDIQATTDAGGGFNVGWIDAGEWLAYDVRFESSGEYTFAVRVASPNSGRSFHLEIDGVNVTGSLPVPNTRGWQTWTTVTTGTVQVEAGVRALRFVADTNGFNFNYIDVTRNTAEVPSEPTAPSNLSATAVSSGQIDLAWTDDADHADNLDIERSLDEATWDLIATLTADITGHSDTDVSGSTTYHYRVIATNSVGSSAPSNTASATTHAAPSAPAAPSNLQATAVSATRIDLTWTDNANNEDNMVVERSFDGSTWSVLATLPANTTSHSDTSVRVNSTYHYRVSASNAAGNSAPSPSTAASTATSLPGRVQAQDYREGGSGFGYHDTTPGNTGGVYRNDDVDIQATSDVGGGFNVGWVDAGEWLAYDVRIEESGEYTFAVRVATIHAGRNFRLEIDGVNVSGTLAVPNTGGWQTWTTVTTGAVQVEAGVRTLRFVAGTNGFNFNYIDVSTSQPPPWATVFELPGRIEVENYRVGGPGVGYHDTTLGNSGGVYRNDDVDIQATSDTGGGFNVGWVDAGEWLAYDVSIPMGGTYILTIRVASPNSGRRLHIEINDVDVTGPIAVPNTGDWQTWTSVTSSPVTLEAGAHTLKIVAETNGFNMNYLELNPAP